jgi:hypothetical protein
MEFCFLEALASARIKQSPFLRYSLLNKNPVNDQRPN